MDKLIDSPEIEQSFKVIDIGSVVEIHYDGDGEDENEKIQIVGVHGEGSTEVIAKKTSRTSAVGEAIFGKEAGYIAPVHAPNGDVLFIKVISVE